MQLTLYTNFSKRKNSTKQPTGGTVHEVKLKDGCSTENPTFLINGIDLNVNYAKWNDSYYFVTDIILNNNNIYEISCAMDSLATWKSVIGNSTQFIERSASAYDILVNDTMLSTTQEIINTNTAVTNLNSIDGFDSVTGTYLVQIMGHEGLNVYAITTLSSMAPVFNTANYPIDHFDINAVIASIGFSAMDISSLISNIMWVPIDYNYLDGLVGTIKLGFCTIENSSAKKLTTRSFNITGGVAVPDNVYSDFRKYNQQFSAYDMFLPGVGSVSIDSLDVNETLTFSLTIDIFTGNAQYFIYNNSNRLVATYSAQLGVQIPYCATKVDALGALHSTAKAISGITTPWSALANSAALGIELGNTIVSPTVSLNGAAGNISSVKLRPYIQISLANYGSKEFALAEIGRPLMEHRTINTLSGFIKCGGASIDVPGVSGEKDEINAYLNGGFYFE